jgi:hypothetical protein
LGFAFHNCFCGQALLDVLCRTTGCDVAAASAAGEALRKAGFLHHTLRSFKFSKSCFFFWNDDTAINQLMARMELQHQHG